MDQFNWTLVGIVAIPGIVFAAIAPAYTAAAYFAGCGFMFTSMFMYTTSYRYYNRIRRTRRG